MVWWCCQMGVVVLLDGHGGLLDGVVAVLGGHGGLLDGVVVLLDSC